jgi:hypothetical protein
MGPSEFAPLGFHFDSSLTGHLEWVENGVVIQLTGPFPSVLRDLAVGLEWKR